MTNITNEQGRSMVEMLGVLAIIGVIATGALAGYSQALLKFRTSRTADEIQAISDEVFQTYSWMRSYPDKGSYASVQDRLIADGVTIPSANPFGGTYTVTTTTSSITVTTNNIPTDACTQLAAESADWQNTDGLGSCGTTPPAEGEQSPAQSSQTFTITFL